MKRKAQKTANAPNVKNKPNGTKKKAKNKVTISE